MLATKCEHCTGAIDPWRNAVAEFWSYVIVIAVILLALSLLTQCVG